MKFSYPQVFMKEKYEKSYEMNKNVRFSMVLDELKERKLAKTYVQIAETLGTNKAGINDIKKERKRVSSDILNRLKKSYPQVNIEWIITGIGDMFLDVETPPLPEGAIPMSKIKMKPLPLIPLEAAAGIFRGEANALRLEECEHYLVPFFPEADFLITISGDSMQPTYSSGDLAACKFVTPFDIFFQWGKPYIIDTEDGILIKRVYEGDEPSIVNLISDNPTYTTIACPRDKVYRVSRVLGVIRRE